MAYPKKLLSPGEEVLAEFKPHWTSILGPLGITLAALLVVVFLAFFTTGGLSQFGPLVAALVWLVLIVPKVIDWMTTVHVITNERVIHRTGFVAKTGKEIPLEMINTVSFHQSVFERVVGSGDLVIESAGETGQTLYTDIPRAEEKKNLIYRAREDRMFSIERGGAGVSTAEQLQILSRLHDEGKLSAEEFNNQKSRLLGNE
ncbi:MAG: PH domain-containing protein [Actinomycetota bacterium]